MSPIELDVPAAALAGVIAGPIMELPAYLQRGVGLPLRQDVFAEGGEILRVRGRAQRVVGYLGHATLSVLIALLYATFFRLIAAQNHLLAWGALGGLVHFTIGGFVVAVAFPVVDPSSAAAGHTRVGFAYAHYGRRDVLTFIGGHVIFGLIIGALYPALHAQLSIAAAT